MSESKARLYEETEKLKTAKSRYFLQLVRLVAYVHNMQTDHPELLWEELPDAYDEIVWRYAV